VVDFHALRTTFGTNLARGGVSLVMAQRLMRHSTPTLTANVYTVLSRDDERAAVAALPDWTGPAAEEQRATGTDGAIEQTHLRADLREEAGKRGDSRDGAGLSTSAKPSSSIAPEPAETRASEPAEGGEFAPFGVVGRTGFEPVTSTL